MNFLVSAAIPLIPVVIPLIVDTAMGHDIEGDIIVMRNNSEEKIP